MERLARHMLQDTLDCDPSIEACQSSYSEATEDPKASDLLNLTLTLPVLDIVVPYLLLLLITELIDYSKW